MKRTAIKRGTKSLKRTSLKKKYKSKEEIAENRAETAEMWNFFLDLWKKKPHFCEQDGTYLGEEPLTVFFHHLLPKSKYPEYKLKDWNIMILSFNNHQQAEQDISKVPKVKFKRDLLLKQIGAIL